MNIFLPPLPIFFQEILMEMFSENLSEGDDSRTHLIKAPERDAASPLYHDVDDLLERALDDSYDEESATSFI